MTRDKDAIVPSVPEDWTPPAYLVLPKYSKRELQFLAARLQESNFELRQKLFRMREQLDREAAQ